MRFFLFLFALITLISCAENKPQAVAVTQETVTDANPATTPTPTTTPNPIIDTTFTVDYIMGKFEPATHPDFTEINPPYSDEKRYLRKDVLVAFIKMYDAAKADGINLKVESATRNFANQKRIWEAKWTGKRLIEGGKDATKAWPNPKDRALTILKWSSMPGTSRHHWGTDIDINEFENDYFEKGEGLKEYEWLVANGAKFGFCQVYTPKDATRPTGYNEEKWHWTYMPISQKITQIAQQNLKDKMISGFKGSEVAGEVGMVKNFVLGINQGCL